MNKRVKCIPFILVLSFFLANCHSKKQIAESREISDVHTETSDIIIADSAAKQTKGVRVGNSYLRPSNQILENISAVPNIKIFKRLLQKTDLLKTLAGKGPFTLFIPTDEAFATLPPGETKRLLQSLDPDQRRLLIEHLLVPGKIVTADLEDKVVLKAADGARLEVSNNGRIIKVGSATITVKDGVSNNGVVHLLDRVLLPEFD